MTGHPGHPPGWSWRVDSKRDLPVCPQILLLAFLKLIEEGSHMVMLECPETVNTLLHEFLLWEPEPEAELKPQPEPLQPEPAPVEK